MLTFTRRAADAVADHASEGAPAEVCGVLGGSRGQSSESDDDAQRDRVTDVYRTENVAESPRTRYRIDPERQLAVLERIDAEGLDVVGFYHSHPTGPAEPSETDAARATWRGYAYTRGVAVAWVIDGIRAGVAARGRLRRLVRNDPLGRIVHTVRVG